MLWFYMENTVMDNLLENKETAVEEMSSECVAVQTEKKKRHFWGIPTNADIDSEEIRTNHFAKGINCYKLLMICYIGCFVGVILEMWWWYLKKGVIESRAGLVYGPFNLLYGVGTVAMTLMLYRYRNKNFMWAFAGGFVVGTVLEYVCSLMQELIFGTQSWDYSRKPFNIDGRVCLLYSIFWGVLGILWIKVVYPWLSKIIMKIPQHAGKIAVWVLCAFFVFNSVVTVISSYRWQQRDTVPEPTNGFWRFIDERFPDERMEKIFPNMKKIKD